jgi:DNA-binding transcriptional MerR regulator
MMSEKLQNLSLAELSEKVRLALTRYGLLKAQADSRVQAVPDARTIRYYTTLGLIDRPAVIARQARYGQRHILQIVAIKALQGASLPLAEIQSRLYGKSDQELEAVIDAVSQSVIERRELSHNTVVWKEIVLEPGLKVLANSGWHSAESTDDLVERFRQVVELLATDETKGGSGND